MNPDHKLSPRCFSGSSSSINNHHSRQLSLISSSSTDISSYSSTLCNKGVIGSQDSPIGSNGWSHHCQRSSIEVSPTSVDLGYQTLLGSLSGNQAEKVIASKNSKLKVKKKLGSHLKNPWDKVPDQIVLRIFKLLDSSSLIGSVALVNKRFNSLAWNPTLWRSICLQGLGKEPMDWALESILSSLARRHQNCDFVDRIVIKNCGNFTDLGMESIADFCPDLTSLETVNCSRITCSGIKRVATKCPSLSLLNISGCNLISGIEFELTGPCPQMAAMGGVPPAPSRTLFLRCLDMTDCSRLMDNGLEKIVKFSPHLTQLYLRRCVNVTDIGIKHVAGYAFGLRELSVSDCVQITDFGMYELAKLGPILRYLSIAKCDQISDSGLSQIVQLCYKLRYLNVRGCEMVSDKSITVLAKSCGKLRSLDIGKCDVTDGGLQTLAQNLGKNLRKLSVKSCDLISDNGINAVAHHCQDLQQLNIQDCQVTFDGYRLLKKHCKKCIIEHTNPSFY